MTLRRADWIVTPCTQREAVEFIEATHYAMGAPNTSVARHALRRRTEPDVIKGVALWLPPTRRAAESVNRRQPRGVLALSRLCVAEDVPRPNGASFLLGASMRLLDRRAWPTLLTYADTSYGHTGAIYRATNWTCLGEVPGADAWVSESGERRGRKRGKRNYSVLEMTALGFKRLPSAPKVKFIHHIEPPKEKRVRRIVRRPRPVPQLAQSARVAAGFLADQGDWCSCKRLRGDVIEGVHVKCGRPTQGGTDGPTPIDIRSALRNDARTGVGTVGDGIGEAGDPAPTLSTSGATPAVFVKAARASHAVNEPLAIDGRSGRTHDKTGALTADMDSARVANRRSGTVMVDAPPAAECGCCPADPKPDSPRYRACGNAVTVPVIEWIGRSMLSADAP